MTQEGAPYREAEGQRATFSDESCADREAWAAWRQLLDAAQPGLVAALGKPAAVADRVQRRIARRQRRLSLAAAALLLACGAFGWLEAGRALKSAPPRQSRALSADVAEWDSDALDQELAWTLYCADAVESQWRRPADGLAYVRQRMDALEAEFDGNSL